jgi:hypothetical protein
MDFTIWFEDSYERADEVESWTHVKYADVLEDKFKECMDDAENRGGEVRPVRHSNLLRVGFTHVNEKGESTTYMSRLSTLKACLCKDPSRREMLQQSVPSRDYDRESDEERVRRIIDERVREDKKEAKHGVSND